MKNNYMLVDSFTKSEHFGNLKGYLQELTFYLFDKLEKIGIRFKIHTGESIGETASTF